MVADHFHIEPGKVEALSADFHSAAVTLGGQITAFGSKAENVNDAFGVLAESTDALQKYVTMTQATVVSLQQLQAQLEGYSQALATTVTNYQTADQHNSRRLAV
ncbi:ESX-1 secretion-associated protein [Streptomyces tateyamensis]|uniref:ESX-1 secretion-associated protein n=1 Tax=Streptomyces tateyamensis TaxID=565073 RepID=A0A2V4N8D1_9ACTN|nr:type VII secretion target [Streptomyces tateyamensis]PYC68027.1 ESX-1 secretion-associated protein [Streptomyces tateyamensis]